MNLPVAWMLVGLSAAASAAASAAESPCEGWVSQPRNAWLEYIVHYEGAPAAGSFGDFTVCAEFDPEAPESGRLAVEVDVLSADMDSADINAAIQEAEWFGSDRFPRACFSSGSIRREGERFVARGELTLKGATRPVEVPFTWSARPDGALMSGALTLNRTDFDIGSGEWSGDGPIGHDVEIRFSVPLETPR